MPYGEIRVDTITFTNGGVDTSISVSGLAASTTGNLTVTGTISGTTVRATTVSGVTVTGTTVQGASGTFTSITGGTATITSGLFASGTAANPSIAIIGDANTGLYSPGADQLAIATSGTGRLFVDASGNVSVGTYAAPDAALTLSRSGNSYLFLHDATSSALDSAIGNVGGSIVFRNGANVGTVADLTERMRLDSSGRLGLGTSSPGATADIYAAGSGIKNILNIRSSLDAISDGGAITFSNTTPASFQLAKIASVFEGGTYQGSLRFYTNTDTEGASPSEKMRITPAGRVGIGTTPSYLLHLLASNTSVGVQDSGANGTRALIEATNSAVYYGSSYSLSNIPTIFSQAGGSGGVERMRIDTSGRLLVGTSTARANLFNSTISPQFQVEGTGIGDRIISVISSASAGSSGPSFAFGKQNSGTIGGNTAVASGDNVGNLFFQGNDGTEFVEAASISAFVDGTPGANDMPGRLVFSTTADGASSPTERMRIDSSGRVGIGTAPNRTLHLAASSGTILSVERTGANTSAIWLAALDGYSAIYSRAADASSTAADFAFINGSTERARIDSSGRLLVGTSTSSGDGCSLQIRNDSGLNLELFRSSASNSSPFAEFSKSRGTSSSPTVVLNGDNLGTISFRGYSGAAADYVAAAFIQAQVDGTPDSGGDTTDMPGRIVFSTTADGASTPTERMRITSAGYVGIGTTAPAATLHSRSDNAGSGSTPMLIQNRSVSANTAVGISFAPNTSDTADRSAIIYGVNSSGGSGNATDLTFHTNANGGSPSEKVRIDSSGRLLIGTSSSRQVNASINALQFQIEGTAYQASSMSLVTNQNAADGSYIVLGKSRGTSLNSTTIVNSGDSLGALWFCGADGNTMPRGAVIEAFVDGTPGASDMPGRLAFSTTADGASSPTERMRIGNSGFTNLFVTANDGFQSRNSAAAGTTIAVFAGRHSATSTTDGTISFQVWTNGNVQNTNNSYTAISDIKLKENIVDASSQWADLKALRVRNYNLKEGQTHKQIGLVAQEVEPISPGLVYESPDRDAEGNDLGTVTKSVNYSVLYMKAVKALQEAMKRIETLEAKVAALEAA